MGLILCLMVIFIFTSNQAYRYTMFTFDIESLCTDKKCHHKWYVFNHTICQTDPSPSCKTKNFSPMKMDRQTKLFSLMGINGIRNRVAGILKIANMNLLHWDRHLEEMAKKTLWRCVVSEDPCNFLYNESFSIGQTLNFSERPPVHAWYVAPIRSWYSEMNHLVSKPPKSIEEFKKQYNSYLYFPQLIWPTSEFVGCAAARLLRGYMMTCFFHPRTNFSDFNNTFIENYPCTECPFDRPTCSREFIKLCGLDIKIMGDEDSAVNLILNWNIILLWFLALYMYNCLYSIQLK